MLIYNKKGRHMVKILTGLELLSLYRRKKIIHRLVRWNPEYVQYRQTNWLKGSVPPQEPFELTRVATLTYQSGEIVYILRMLCSDNNCGCRSGNVKHPWVVNEDGIPVPNPSKNPHPAFAKHGAFIINP